MRRNAFFYVLIAISLLVGCGRSKGRQTPFEASGRALQLVAVLPDSHNSEEFKATIEETFSGPIGVLPQEEPACDMMYTTHSGFNKLFRIFRNILYIDIDDQKYTRAGLHISRDEFAGNQLIITAKSPDMETMKELLTSQREYLSDLYYKEELSRRRRDLAHTYSSKMAKMIEDSIGGVTANPIEAIKYVNGKKGFVWGSTQDPKGRIDIVVYDFPYTDPNTFTTNYLVRMRDSVMMANIPGEYPNSYMSTEKRFPQKFTAFELDGVYRAEMRGLWQMEGDMMGGPYVMQALVDEANSRVVVIEAFVFAPGKDKRNLLLTGESVLYTLRPIGTEVQMSPIKVTR